MTEAVIMLSDKVLVPELQVGDAVPLPPFNCAIRAPKVAAVWLLAVVR